MQENKWSLSKKLYLALSIVLSIQVIPGIGMLLNMIFIVAISGLALSIVLLVTTAKDQVSKAGALLGLITFAMAIVSGMFSWALGGRVGSGATLFIFTWMFLNWCVCIAAVIVSYINTFAKKRNPSDYVGASSFPGTSQMKAPKATETVKVGFGGDIALSEVKFHENKSATITKTTIKPVEVVTVPPNIPTIQKIEPVNNLNETIATEVDDVVKEDKEITYVTQVMGADLNKILEADKVEKESTIVSADKLEK